jgi:uncharacterized protein (UPF0332 family)
MFHKEFVKSERVSLETGKLYGRLFNLRQKGDYSDFQKFTQEEIYPFLANAQRFITEIEKII